MTYNLDQLAGWLGHWAHFARQMPPAWDGARVSQPLMGPQLESIGRMLPGRGLYVDLDLKQVGIQRSIPSVFERTPVQRYLDVGRTILRREGLRLWADERGAIATYDDIIKARGNAKGNDIAFAASSITTVANVWYSLLRSGGSFGSFAYGTTFPTQEIEDRSKAGAWTTGITNPASPNKKYLITFGYTASQNLNMLMLVDILETCGGISQNTSTTQSYTGLALTRNTGGAGNLIIYEQTTLSGATAQTINVTYTNQAGTGSRTTGAISMFATCPVQRLQPSNTTLPFMFLQAGDYGVRSVESHIFSAANATGAIALNIYYPLMFIPGIIANVYVERDATIQIDGITELFQSSSQVLGCLSAFVLANTTSTGTLVGFMRTVEG